MIANAGKWKDTYAKCGGNDYIKKTYAYAEAYSYGNIYGAASIKSDLAYKNKKNKWVYAYGFNTCAPRSNPYVSVKIAPPDCLVTGSFVGTYDLPNYTSGFWDSFA